VPFLPRLFLMMLPIRHLPIAALVFGLLLVVRPVDAQFMVYPKFYTSGSGFVSVDYAPFDIEFRPFWQVAPGALINGAPITGESGFAPADLVAVTSATRASPTGLSSVMGVADGAPIYVAGSSLFQPNLGVSVASLDPADWTGSITITLSDWTIPHGAAFSLYTTNPEGTAVEEAFFSTFAITQTLANNSFTLAPGSQAHFQWGFTDPGFYTLEFTWTGHNTSSGPVSDHATFTFQVVPEPSTVMLLILALAPVAIMRRRRMA